MKKMAIGQNTSQLQAQLRTVLINSTAPVNVTCRQVIPMQCSTRQRVVRTRSHQTLLFPSPSVGKLDDIRHRQLDHEREVKDDEEYYSNFERIHSVPKKLQFGPQRTMANLRQHPRVLSAMQYHWWLACDDCQATRCNRFEFTGAVARWYLAMIPGVDHDHVTRIAAIEWSQVKKKAVSNQVFFDKLFAVTHNWCQTTDMHEYCRFLSLLFHRIALPDWDASTFTSKPLDKIVSFSEDEHLNNSFSLLPYPCPEKSEICENRFSQTASVLIDQKAADNVEGNQSGERRVFEQDSVAGKPLILPENEDQSGLFSELENRIMSCTAVRAEVSINKVQVPINDACPECLQDGRSHLMQHLQLTQTYSSEIANVESVTVSVDESIYKNFHNEENSDGENEKETKSCNIIGVGKSADTSILVLSMPPTIQVSSGRTKPQHLSSIISCSAKSREQRLKKKPVKRKTSKKKSVPTSADILIVKAERQRLLMTDVIEKINWEHVLINERTLDVSNATTGERRKQKEKQKRAKSRSKARSNRKVPRLKPTEKPANISVDEIVEAVSVAKKKLID